MDVKSLGSFDIPPTMEKRSQCRRQGFPIPGASGNQPSNSHLGTTVLLGGWQGVYTKEMRLSESNTVSASFCSDLPLSILSSLQGFHNKQFI
jgi:hypothetical protein